jgi:PKHD-type hydroxylase
MYLNNQYYIYRQVLTSNECRDIISLGLSKNIQTATIMGNKKPDNKQKLKELKKTRNSQVSWLNEPWLYNIFIPLVDNANSRAQWNFDINWAENFQFTKYEKTNHYSWHMDSNDKPYQSPDPNFNGKIRKISLIASLSDSNDYEGGDLQIDLSNIDNRKPNIVTIKELRQKGSVVIFPSFMWHRVTPITKGTRFSLVMWNIGNPFK